MKDLIEKIDEMITEDSSVKMLDAILDQIGQGQKKLDGFIKTMVNTRTPDQKKYAALLKSLSGQIGNALDKIENARQKYE